MKHIKEWNDCIVVDLEELYICSNCVCADDIISDDQLEDCEYEIFTQLIAQYFFPEDAL